jgi:broad specificity phosphatase PhoE
MLKAQHKPEELIMPLRFWSTAIAAIVALAGTAKSGDAQAQAPLGAVIIVRHGEKATAPKENPPLSPAGAARARALHEALRDGGVTAIVTTDQLRTRATAAPLLATLHLKETVVPRSPDPREDAAATAAAVRRAGGTVLVIGHQLTIPLVITALGGPAVATMCDVEFSNMYVLLPSDSARLQLIRSHYGNPDPARRADCHITPVSPP